LKLAQLKIELGNGFVLFFEGEMEVFVSLPREIGACPEKSGGGAAVVGNGSTTLQNLQNKKIV
jgi:hypothetical protein